MSAAPLRIFRAAKTGRADSFVGERGGEYRELGAADGLLALLAARPWHAFDTLPQASEPREPSTPIALRDVGKILALGKNFRAHAEEFDEAVPEEPLFFNKLPELLVPHGARVAVPAWYTGRVDHEAELALVIGREGAHVPESEAMDYVAGYTVANDLTARHLQGADRDKKYPWFRGKNLDGFCPLGPCFVPADELDPNALAIRAHVRHADGSESLRQDANTRDWIVKIPQALAWLSKHLTLRPGDLVLTGTPAGVGPLIDGDRVTCEVEGIGALTTHIERA